MKPMLKSTEYVRLRNTSISPELDDRVTSLLERGDYPSRSAIYVEALRCFFFVLDHYGHWLNLKRQPLWLDTLLEKLQHVQVTHPGPITEDEEQTLERIFDLRGEDEMFGG